ncbi:DUF2688 domain-containing protein [Klebsiella quasipneumoniae]|uniref:DUF2688 domain-containing protein n=1 Tax=Klebsiella quasipneumoniae TaxID=1463165 RepID=UPI003890BD66
MKIHLSIPTASVAAAVSPCLNIAFGANSLKAELGQICAECLTPEENQRISKEIMELAVRRVCRNINASSQRTLANRFSV